MTFPGRALVLLAGLAGATGVGLSAVAAHRGGAHFGIAANFLLMHAPALLAISLLSTRLAWIGGFTLFIGLALFCGDLVARDVVGAAPLPSTAPAGGVLLICGWLIVALSAFERPR